MKIVKTALCSRYYLWLAAALLGLLVIQISGCASVPEGSADMKQQAMSFSPPQGKAGIYLIRPYHIMGSAVLYKFSLDDFVFDSSLKTKSYVFGLVSPGLHTFYFPGPGSESPIHYYRVDRAGVYEYLTPETAPRNSSQDGVASFTAEAGGNYFFLVNCGSVKMQIDRLSDAEGKAYVSKFELSGDSRFEHQTIPSNGASQSGGAIIQSGKAIILLNRTTVSAVRPEKYAENDYGLNIQVTSYGYSLMAHLLGPVSLMINDKEIDRWTTPMAIDREDFIWHPGVGQVLPSPLSNPLTLEQAQALSKEIMER